MGVVRQNKIKVLLCVVACLCSAVALASAVMAFAGGKEFNLNLLYVSLLAVFLTGLTVSFAADRYKRALHTVLLRKLRKGEYAMDIEIPEIFQNITGKEVLIVMATGGSFKGVVREISGNWLKLEDKHGEGLLNIGLISSVSIIPEKKQG